MSKGRLDMELFVTTMKEYKRFANYLPLNSNNQSLINTTFDEAVYIAINVRLILMRKYVNKNDAMFYERIIDEVKNEFVDDLDILDDMKTRFSIINNQSFEQVLSDGTKLNLYESIEDIMYGLYLHADQDKIIRLSYTDKLLRFFCTHKFVKEIEVVLIELYDFLSIRNVQEIGEVIHSKASVVNLDANGAATQSIQKSPYWENLYGSEMNDGDIKATFVNFSEEEIEVYFIAHLFLEELGKDDCSIENLRNMVHASTIESWGDFSEAVSFFKSIQNVGMSNRIRFNDERYTAYVRIIPHVVSPFVTNTPQVISGVYDITLYKAPGSNEWKIFRFGDPIDPHVE